MRGADKRAEIVTLDLNRLAVGLPALTKAAGRALAEAASAYLERAGHGTRVPLTIDGAFKTTVIIKRLGLTQRMISCYANIEEATELGACGIAALVIRELTNFTVFERSIGRNGFDYWL